MRRTLHENHQKFNFEMVRVLTTTCVVKLAILLSWLFVANSLCILLWPFCMPVVEVLEIRMDIIFHTTSSSVLHNEIRKKTLSTLLWQPRSQNRIWIKIGTNTVRAGNVYSCQNERLTLWEDGGRHHQNLNIERLTSPNLDCLF